MNDKMKFPDENSEQIDDLFRSTLGSHTVEPTDKLWKGISRKLLWNELLRFNLTNVSKGYILTGVAVVTVIVGMMFLYPGKKQSLFVKPYQVTDTKSKGQKNIPATPREQGLQKTSSGYDQATAPSSGTSVPSQSAKNQSINNKAIHKPIGSSVQPNPSVSSKKSEAIASVSKGSPEPEKTTGSLNQPIVNVKERSLINPITFTEQGAFMKFNALSYRGLFLNIGRDTLLSFKTPNGIMKVQKQKPRMNKSFSADLGITPEVMIYKTSSVYSEMNYWLNANLAYNFSKFSIRTGVSLGYVFDEGKYQTKYISKDSIGYFTSVISFYVNPENQNEIIFNTKNVAVYDSLQHFADDRTRNRYTYLEFPLLFGYRILETNNFSMDVLAGPAFTLLVGTRKAEPFIDYPNARIVRVDEKTADRLATSWKLALGVHLEYRVSRNLGCYLEPFYKYYLTSLTRKESTSSGDPYSIGIGLGIRYHFGQLTK